MLSTLCSLSSLLAELGDGAPDDWLSCFACLQGRTTRNNRVDVIREWTHSPSMED